MPAPRVYAPETNGTIIFGFSSPVLVVVVVVVVSGAYPSSLRNYTGTAVKHVPVSVSFHSKRVRFRSTLPLHTRTPYVSETRENCLLLPFFSSSLFRPRSSGRSVRTRQTDVYPYTRFGLSRPSTDAFYENTQTRRSLDLQTGPRSDIITLCVIGP